MRIGNQNAINYLVDTDYNIIVDVEATPAQLSQESQRRIPPRRHRPESKTYGQMVSLLRLESVSKAIRSGFASQITISALAVSESGCSCPKLREAKISKWLKRHLKVAEEPHENRPDSRLASLWAISALICLK
ncbi:hypothetical protein [Roseobacter weihaiensis]|uniref:hypothetical protein n=1 Tax=Roseobacter weihaiensis TaxID=2763262 RepID=UPI001D0A57C1|nr:hypothetical protein [Roseobacter sp. H9]